MKKVGIVTLFGYYNFGNRLQNYALERTLRKLGYDADTIVFESPRGKGGEKAATPKRSLFLRMAEMSLSEIAAKAAGRIYRVFNGGKIRARVDKKTELLRDFSEKHLHVVGFGEDFQVLNYDCFIVGSDQVWNPSAVVKNGAFFLPFAPECKRAAYAASFGVYGIPEDMADVYAAGLRGFKSISVREPKGRDIVKNLTGRECPVLPDPTMLLTGDEWLDFASPSPRRPVGGYVLLYFLGKTPPGAKKAVKRFARVRRLAVVDIMDSRRDFFAASPREFVDYIANADFVFTDSFHGSVLSIVLHTPFAVFRKINDSADQYSRIENLLSMFGMVDRAFENVSRKFRARSMDFSGADEILSSEYLRAVDFLKSVLENG